MFRLKPQPVDAKSTLPDGAQIDGANDLKFMAECGVSVAYRAKPIVRGQTTHAINYVDLSGVLNLFN